MLVAVQRRVMASMTATKSPLGASSFERLMAPVFQPHRTLAQSDSFSPVSPSSSSSSPAVSTGEVKGQESLQTEEPWRWGPRIFFPNVPLMLKTSKRKSTQVVFKTTPKMTKFEIKQLLTKMYGLDVRKVNTLNQDGDLRRSKRARGVNVKKADFKKAYVTLSKSSFDSLTSSSSPSPSP
eukprot:TRINITY_DN1275_c0_g1_i1.p2 TRINITY_DN1275_c0_g1~~TRINITY_DN1275_c0_g1_i1.p2  ORF type:complete len:187 (-),score=79.55 TRINITY_DN1275_c0_g1_i1:80-619(-)